jgi:hypothetical protein
MFDGIESNWPEDEPPGREPWQSTPFDRMLTKLMKRTLLTGGVGAGLCVAGSLTDSRVALGIGLALVLGSGAAYTIIDFVIGYRQIQRIRGYGADLDRDIGPLRRDADDQHPIGPSL